jgi:uncharacterized protein with NRDE domain
MCLILLAWQVHPDYPLIVAANRDEFYARPSAPAGFWPESPGTFAGRDLEAGGTWLGITRQQRFAALTNFREGARPRADAQSRGSLVADFLAGNCSPESYFAALSERSNEFNGFNLLFGDGNRLGYVTNRGNCSCWLTPGIYGLSNHLLDTPWPKLSAAKRNFDQALTRLPDSSRFFEMLADQEIVADAGLPETGVPLEWERILSAIFVNSPDYGTRASTLLSCHRSGQVKFSERSFGPDAVPLGEVSETFQSSLISTGVYTGT